MTQFHFNELSVERADRNVDDVFDDFCAAIATLAGASEVELVSVVSLPGLEVSGGRAFREWGAEASNRDPWRLVLTKAAGDPARCWAIRQELLGGDVEVNIDGDVHPAATATAAIGSAMVSLGTTPQWRLHILAAEGSEVRDDDIVASTFDVRNVDCAEGARDYLAGLPETPVENGADLWERRATLFPHLEFLDNVESHLRSLQLAWLGPVHKRLVELELSTAEWDTLNSPEPTWRSYITPESSSRRDRFWFADGGELQLFEIHARFTPGAGRIYFRAIRERRVLRIAHVGEHL